MKKKSNPMALLRLVPYLLKYKWWLLLAFFLSAGSNLLALLGPYLSGKAIDVIELGSGRVDLIKVAYYCVLLVGFYALASFLTYCLSILMVHVGKSIVARLRNDVFFKLTLLPVNYYDRQQTGDIISRISYDIDLINTSLSSDLLQIATSLFTVVGSLVMMFVISWQLLLIFCVTVPLSIYLTSRITRRSKPMFRARSAKAGEFNGYIEETLSGLRAIIAYNREEYTTGQFSRVNQETSDAFYKSYYYSIQGPTMGLVNNLSLAAISVWGAVLFLTSRITLGNLSSFVLYSRKFSGPINEVANIIAELQSTASAAERIFKVLDESNEPADQKDALELSEIKGQGAMEHVDFGYVENQLVLKDISFVAKAGKTVAIVGPTGSGKTTIINLLMRFYDAQKGAILIDDHNILEVTRKSLRLAYSMVLQESWLFYGTIFENIAYGKPEATMEEVVKVAKAARIHRYIESLPQGYDTLLNEDAINISQGQKQLLAIARAMLLQSHMLILDEATSNIDTQTEIEIQKAMLSLMKNKTCFVIAHRLSTIQNADLILVIRDGEIIESGNHKQLLKKQGFYHQLFMSQFN
ncbi:MAG: ABC transporter ATP-binding protein/permease [Erysipelotrichaceae bacterium]|jgi:ATP-binding cassette subfamily B protein|nr:ABC transporter ATP-binding protein/permease [Erysipelotrichaceae bacterium]